MWTTKVCDDSTRISLTIEYLMAYSNGIGEVHGPKDTFARSYRRRQYDTKILTCVWKSANNRLRQTSSTPQCHLFRLARWSYALACDHRLPIRPPSHLFAIHLLTRPPRSGVNAKSNSQPGTGSYEKVKNWSSGRLICGPGTWDGTVIRSSHEPRLYRISYPNLWGYEESCEYPHLWCVYSQVSPVRY